MSDSLRLAMAAPKKRKCGIFDYANFLAESLGTEFVLRWIHLPTASSANAWKNAAAQADSADVVHVHFEPSLFNIPRPYHNLFATFMDRLQPPALITLHDAIPQVKPLWLKNRTCNFFYLARDLAFIPHYRTWEKRQYKRAAHWVVHSPELAFRTRKLVGPDRVSLALHPVPSVGRVWSVDEEHPLDLISPGFIKSHKGYLELLDPLAELQEVNWELAGGPQDQYDRAFCGQLKTKIEQLDLKNRVRVTGYLERPDLESISIQAKAAILPFSWAAGSGSLTWAIGMGMPVLATDLPAMLQFKALGAGIKLLPLHSPEVWRELIDAVLRDQDEQAALSAANLKFAKKHGYGELAKRTQDLYHNLVHAESKS